MERVAMGWQGRRADYNHDWLKNQYMPALAKCLNLLDGRIEDWQFEQRFASYVLPQWEVRFEDVVQIAEDFEHEMSPRKLVQQMGFSSTDERWLAEIVHELWLARYRVRGWVEVTLACAYAANAAYEQLRGALAGCSTVSSAEVLRPFRDQLSAFRNRCEELAKSIEQFPSEIKVT